jgi:hypothetical protein
MINYIPTAFYNELVARDEPLSCDGHANCDVNIGNATRSQWDKFPQGAKVGIIVGAAIGATLLISIVTCCVWRYLRKRRSS